MNNRNSLDSIVIRLRAGRPGFVIGQGQGIIPFVTASWPPMGSTQSPIQWEERSVSSGVKWPGREMSTHNHLQPKLRIRGAIPPLPNTSSCRCA